MLLRGLLRGISDHDTSSARLKWFSAGSFQASRKDALRDLNDVSIGNGQFLRSETCFRRAPDGAPPMALSLQALGRASMGGCVGARPLSGLHGEVETTPHL